VYQSIVLESRDDPIVIKLVKEYAEITASACTGYLKALLESTIDLPVYAERSRV
jgi:hypothetical protein